MSSSRSAAGAPDAERLAAHKHRLAELDRERAEVVREIAAITTRDADRPANTPTSASEKVAVFRELFVSRNDVFALRWSSAKTGRSGYAPACAHEWEKPICRKPEIKCNACTHRELLPLTDRVLLAHLRGHHVVGVYPLRRDGTCSFLAFDLDKRTWQDDVVAVREAARSFGCEPLLERSRSGEGAHVWIFFAGRVPAVRARRLGDRILHRAMDARDRLPLASFDRIFPHQDTLPAGGFGNLIALPLQREARAHGNTQFLDDALLPVADPWPLLASAMRLTPDALDALTSEPTNEPRPRSHSGTPWTPRTPIPRSAPLLAGLRVHVVKANRLYVRRRRLPVRALTRMRRLATRVNPDHIRKRRAGLPTYGTPRFVATAEDHANWLGLPRGVERTLANMIKEEGGVLRARDRRSLGTPTELTLREPLRPWQEAALADIERHDTGVLVAPPGAGKTVLGLALLARRGVSSLILVHRKSLAEQWQAQAARFLGLKSRQLGRYGGGRRKLRGTVDVAMLQALARARDLDERIAPYGQILVDECHHVPAESFEAVVGRAPARYVTGLTATPHRRDGLEDLIFMHCGPVRHQLEPAASGTVAVKHLVVRETAFSSTGDEPYATLMTAAADDLGRTSRIADDVAQAVADGRRSLVLTERRKHLDTLAGALDERGVESVQLHGGLGVRQRRSVLERLDPVGEAGLPVVLATGRFAGEGLDLPHLDTLFLALPVSWKGTVEQYVGRLERSHPGKTDVRVVDYVDRAVPLFARMFEKRRRTYHALGYRTDAPLPLSDTDRL